MKKRKLLMGLAILLIMGLTACGDKELQLIHENVILELGTNPDTAVENYVELEKKAAAEATIDFSAVDVNSVGEYRAVITYKNQKLEMPVIVNDSTEPKVEVSEKTVLAGTPIYAVDVITGIEELSGAVTVSFSEPESADQENVQTTETVDVTEEIDATENKEEVAAEVELDGVRLNNASVIYPVVGEYDNTLTVKDASGNSVDVSVHIIVGAAPVISGVEDITAPVDTKELDYMEGISATDFTGADITDLVICDFSAVDLQTVGDYEIKYVVVDTNGFETIETATVTVLKKEKKVANKDTAVPTGNAVSTGNTDNGGNSGEAVSTGNGGNAGNTGSTGNTGNTGNTGGTGDTGSTGDTGNTGDTGDTGSAGNDSSINPNLNQDVGHEDELPYIDHDEVVPDTTPKPGTVIIIDGEEFVVVE